MELSNFSGDVKGYFGNSCDFKKTSELRVYP